MFRAGCFSVGDCPGTDAYCDTDTARCGRIRCPWPPPREEIGSEADAADAFRNRTQVDDGDGGYDGDVYDEDSEAVGDTADVHCRRGFVYK